MPLFLDGLDGWTSLIDLTVSSVAVLDEALDALRVRPRIARLGLGAFPWEELPVVAEPVPSVDTLRVPAPPSGQGVGGLRPLFPRVTSLALNVSAQNAPLDLTPLHGWPGLHVMVKGVRGPRLVGAGELGDRLSIEPY